MREGGGFDHQEVYRRRGDVGGHTKMRNRRGLVWMGRSGMGGTGGEKEYACAVAVWFVEGWTERSSMGRNEVPFMSRERFLLYP